MVIETDRLISAAPVSPQEEAFERALRPKALDEYIGQQKIRGQLEIFIEAARRRKEPLDHVLLFENTGQSDDAVLAGGLAPNPPEAGNRGGTQD